MDREFCREIKCLYQELMDEAPWDLRILKNCKECKARLFYNWQMEKIFKSEYYIG